MSELPLAKIIARAILRQPQVEAHTDNTDIVFKSKVHKQSNNLYDFEKWLTKQVAEDFGNKKPNELFEQVVIEAAESVASSYQNGAKDAQLKLNQLHTDSNGNIPEDSPQLTEATKALKLAEDMLAFGMCTSDTSFAGNNPLR